MYLDSPVPQTCLPHIRILMCWVPPVSRYSCCFGWWFSCWFTIKYAYIYIHIYIYDSVIYLYLIYIAHNCTLSSLRKVRIGKYLRRTALSLPEENCFLWPELTAFNCDLSLPNSSTASFHIIKAQVVLVLILKAKKISHLCLPGDSSKWSNPSCKGFPSDKQSVPNAESKPKHTDWHERVSWTGDRNSKTQKAKHRDQARKEQRQEASKLIWETRATPGCMSSCTAPWLLELMLDYKTSSCAGCWGNLHLQQELGEGNSFLEPEAKSVRYL